MSHIDAPVTMALTVTRANRKPFTVQPRGSPAPLLTYVPERGALQSGGSAVRELGDKAAAAGMDALREFWTGLSKAGRIALGNGAQLAAWKAIAEAADAQAVDFDNGSAEDNKQDRPPTALPPEAFAGGVSAPAGAASQVVRWKASRLHHPPGLRRLPLPSLTIKIGPRIGNEMILAISRAPRRPNRRWRPTRTDICT